MSDLRHQYRELTDEEKAVMAHIKDLGQQFINVIDESIPAGREASIAGERVEEAVMWAVKGLTS